MVFVSLSPWRLSFSQRHFNKQVPARNFLRQLKRPQILPSASGGDSGLRVFVISDLHTDYSENMRWVKSLSPKRHKKDVLIVAGDVAETFNNFILTVSLLKDRFQHVLFVPGNHDLWCRYEGDDFLDSLEKLNKLLDACRGLGVETNPVVIDGVGIIPLFSWYHEACKDFQACKWPEDLSNRDTSLTLYFDALNETKLDVIKEIQRTCSRIISFSHFVPRQELCPEKRMLFYQKLPKIIGSDSLEVRIRSIHGVEGGASACHVFGHTHFCWDAVLDGIRYVQAPLAYPRERNRRMNGGESWLPFCIYSDGKYADKLSPCYWSDYYAANARAPHNTRLAPWVARFYKQM
ncbi:acyl-carrier-protein phosphodiesterase PptH-like isoform X2 [Mangifera indica]|uniref:acyl-carrier-protein phosphodiesterase PptH-like isoform X2 n=1 Tax=Mangifera indica TaxID=29780 RepID=UPI001CF980CF|nr:acyl-carrier-protein phosphodiesterase PptH-like isoform X2 [Mangifera indica]